MATGILSSNESISQNIASYPILVSALGNSMPSCPHLFIASSTIAALVSMFISELLGSEIFPQKISDSPLKCSDV